MDAEKWIKTIEDGIGGMQKSLDDIKGHVKTMRELFSANAQEGHFPDIAAAQNMEKHINEVRAVFDGLIKQASSVSENIRK